MTLELTTPEIELTSAVSCAQRGPEAERRRQLWGAYRQAKSQAIERFGDFKFGLFIHWGLYAQPGGIWKGQSIEQGEEPHVAEWLMHAHRISRREYAALAESFAPQAFSAAAWADLAMQAGMRYVVLTAKHHDGFALYNSTASRFNSCRAPRFRTDVVAELQRECQSRDLAFGVYYSHSIDWMDGGDGGFRDYRNGKHKPTDLHDRNDWDPAPTSYDDYIRLKSLPQVEELLRQYPDLCCVWFDGGIYTPEKYSFAFYEAVHRLQPQALVSARVGNNFGDFNDPGDNVIPHELTPRDKPWEAIGTINNSWGFKSYDHDWKDAGEIFLWLLEIVSKGGNFMLNMGPDGQGRIPSPNHAVLQRLGAWLRQNGEAVYGTRPWSVANHEGPTRITCNGTEARQAQGEPPRATPRDIWFTCRADERLVYAIIAAVPESQKLQITSLGGRGIERVTELGTGRPLAYDANESALCITLPKIDFNLGMTLKIELTR